jgi:hypothetical protein
MTVLIEKGFAGLFYGTDTNNRDIFVAGFTEIQAGELVEEVQEGLHEGTVILPPAQEQTSDQREETIARLAKHLNKVH